MRSLHLCSGGLHRGLCIRVVWLDIMKFEQTSLFYSASYFNFGGDLELCFGRAKGLCGKTSV